MGTIDLNLYGAGYVQINGNTYPHNNIQILENEFVDWRVNAVRIRNAYRVKIADNIFHAPISNSVTDTGV